MTEPRARLPFTDEEVEWFAAHGVDVGRRQRLEQLRVRQQARNPLRWLWRKLVALSSRGAN